MTTVTGRTERQRQTREVLLAAAREAFLADGYADAALGAIAARAGATTGAIYANFAGKDDLFLAVLDERLGPSLEAQEAILAGDVPLDEALARVGLFLLEEYDEDPRWAAVSSEYWARATREAGFRERVARRHAELLGTVAGWLEGLAAQHGRQWDRPVVDVARCAAALARGMRLERAVGLEAPESFGALFASVIGGLLR
jgi:AcrR family transcriptional regulator